MYALGASIVYFERLILAGRVNKTNRRVAAGTCLLLALKVHQDNLKTAEAVIHEVGRSRVRTVG